MSCRLAAKLAPLLVLLAVSACAGSAPSRSESAAPAASGAPPPPAPPLLSAPADGARYLKPGAGDAQVQADVEDCYTFARAVVEHDQRIEDDRQTVIQGTESRSETTMFREQVEAFGVRSTYRRRFDSCMRGKGYEPQ